MVEHALFALGARLSERSKKHPCHLPRRLLRGDGFEITAGEVGTDSNVGFLAGNVKYQSLTNMPH